MTQYNDRYDSKNNEGFTAGLDVTFKTFLHSLYSKDVSFKVKNGLRMKAEKGEYLCNFAPFGYQKSEIEKNKLIVDEETAPVVRYIYGLALDGLSQMEIARKLNSENIDTPLVHRKKNNTHTSRGWMAKGEVNYWTAANVGRLLRDIRYAGTMVSCKRTQTGPLSRKTKAVPKDEWIVVPDTHEGIVSMEVYEAVQKLLPERDKPVKLGSRTLFSGKVFCGHCGYSLKRQKGKYYYYDCVSHTYAPFGKCISDRIYEYEIGEAILWSFKCSAQITVMAKGEVRHCRAPRSDLSMLLDRLSRKERQLCEQKAGLFGDYADGRITKEKYLELKSDVTSELARISRQKADHGCNEQSLMPFTGMNYVLRIFENLGKVQEITPQIISFVKRIDVFEGKKIEIQFTFGDELTTSFPGMI